MTAKTLLNANFLEPGSCPVIALIWHRDWTVGNHVTLRNSQGEEPRATVRFVSLTQIKLKACYCGITTINFPSVDRTNIENGWMVVVIISIWIHLLYT